MVTAKETMQVALEEFRTARLQAVEQGHERSRLTMRQAADKAWLASCIAVDSFIWKEYHIRVPKTKEAVRFRSRVLVEKQQEEILDRYRAIRDFLHGDVFYNDEGTNDEIRSALARTQEFVELVSR